ncbi:MAG: InlB B-repeat-containing protein, partial [Oscillospiraceae bacterium]|nr:InlB B-repeat-containing protein [Oscillospiraceae bacterium]
MTITPESGAPSLHVWNADFSVVVDASDAQQGTYTVTFRNRHTSAELGRFLVTVLPPEIWTVRFDPNGGSGSMPDMTVERAKKYLLLPACSFTPPAGKQFDTWDVGRSLTYAEITGDTTVRAVWKDREIPQYTVRFDPGSGSGTMADVMVREGPFTLPECAFTPPEGYEFDRWSDGRPGTSVDISSDTILYATWLPKTYTVQFDAAGGTGYMADKNSFYGDPFTLPACSFKAPFGKVFDKWDLGKTGDTVTVTGDTVVKALWKDNFTVSSSTVTGGMKVTVTNRTPAAASILVITAAYDSKGRLVSTATVTGKPTAGKGLGVTVPYTLNDGVKAVKVFILDQAASAPLRSVWSKSVS